MHDLPVPAIEDRLIDLLEADGRASYVQLAAELGIPRVAARRHVTELLRTGVIRIVTAVHPGILGFDAIAHVGFRVVGSTAPLLDALMDLDAAAFVSETTGEVAVVAEVRTARPDQLYRHLEWLRAIPHVAEVRVLLYRDILRNFFLDSRPDSAAMTVDDTDLALITQLQTDGRMTFVTLAEQVHLSAGAVRARVLRMLEADVLRIGAIRRRDTPSKNVILGFGVATAGDALATAEHVRRYRGVEFIARCFGTFDLVATLTAPTMQAAADVIEEVRRSPGVQTVTTWAHLRVRKEYYDLHVEHPARAASAPRAVGPPTRPSGSVSC